jgi:hypothetical protein
MAYWPRADWVYGLAAAWAWLALADPPSDDTVGQALPWSALASMCPSHGHLPARRGYDKGPAQWLGLVEI